MDDIAASGNGDDDNDGQTKGRLTKAGRKHTENVTMYSFFLFFMRLAVFFGVLCLLLGAGMTYCMLVHLHAKDPRPALSFYMIDSPEPETVPATSSDSYQQHGHANAPIHALVDQGVAWGRNMKNWFKVLLTTHSLYLALLWISGILCWRISLDCFRMAGGTESAAQPMKWVLLGRCGNVLGMNMTVTLRARTWLLVSGFVLFCHLSSLCILVEYNLVAHRGMHAIAATVGLGTIILLDVLFDLLFGSTIMVYPMANGFVVPTIGTVRYTLVAMGLVASVVFGAKFENAGNVPALYPNACHNAVTSTDVALLLWEALACWSAVGSLYSFMADFLFLLYTKGKAPFSLEKQNDDTEIFGKNPSERVLTLSNLMESATNQHISRLTK